MVAVRAELMSCESTAVEELLLSLQNTEATRFVLEQQQHIIDVDLVGILFKA